MPIYEAGLWPNNQPPIDLGDIRAKNKSEALKLVLKREELTKKDSVRVDRKGPNSPLARWRQSW